MDSFFTNSNFITIFILIWLGIYVIATLWVGIYKYLILKSMKKQEKDSLKSMISSKMLVKTSVLSNCSGYGKSMLNICRNKALVEATSLLAVLSVISSTAPFIGLFGTVVSILDTFSSFGTLSHVSLNVIAPAISEALIATAAGIFVAIPAYSAHILLSREANIFIGIVDQEIDFLELLESSKTTS